MRLIGALFLMVMALDLASAQGQLLLVQHVWADSPTRDYTDCIQVEGDGSYRFEHTPIDLGQADHRQIHVGKLSEEEMKGLASILDDPALQSLTTPNPSGPGAGGDLWWYKILRSDRSQLLRFARSSGTYYELPATGGLPNISKTPAMKPLLDWYLQISKRKDDIDKTATPTCSLKVRRR